jgi:hypothetical protein
MPNYDLNRLGDKEFERLCQSLLKEVIGSGTITFGEGPDGGREATFTGKAPYPSPNEAWDGEWIFQAKFHDVQRIGPDKARQQVLTDLKTELEKIVNKYKRECENYILITNVPLSSVHERGTHDRIAIEVVPEFLDKVPHIHVWGADEVCRLLEQCSNVRQAYLHFLTPGDLIAELMNYQCGRVSGLAETIRLYMTTSFRREQYAQLDQAGEVGEERMPLQKVFVDLDVQVRQPEDLEKFVLEEPTLFDMRKRSARMHRGSMSAMRILLSEKLSKIVLIGGPGEGKSTLGQYLAQVHRATLLNRLDELNGDRVDLTPLVARIPFRTLLKDYAQWLAETDTRDGLEFYLCERVQERAGRNVSPDEIQAIFQHNPCLLILDGLDEVTERDLRAKMLDRIGEFLERCENVLQADLQVLSTSRPTGYSDQFDPSRFLHLRLISLEPEKVKEYVTRWTKAKLLDESKTQQLMQSIQDCLDDSQVRLLMNTPLQVTILILIVLSGGTPPRQREALFDEYLEVIYKREKAKAKAIIQTEKQLLFGLHQYLGYVLHSRAGEAQDVRSVLEEPEFIKEVRTFLMFHDPFSDDKTLNERVELIVREARERLVLIVELEHGLFGFELRSLQEFFTAAHLADARDSKQRYGRFEAIARPSHWRNVALFFAGRVGRLNSGEAANVLEVCKDIDRHKPDLFLRRGAWLALELAADRSFGPNRRLQRSVLEYGLTLVDIETDGQRARDMRTMLEKLPGEDIRDHVLPILRAKMASLAMPYLETAIDLYHAFDRYGEPLLEVIDVFFRSPVQRDVLFAIKKCLEFNIDPHWVGDRLRQYLSKVPPEVFAEIFAEESLENPGYIQRCLAHCTLDDDYVEALLNQVFSIPVPRRSRRYVSPPPFVTREFFFDLSTPMSQMFSAFHLLELLSDLREQVYRRHRQRLSAGGIEFGFSDLCDYYLIMRDFLMDSLPSITGFLEPSKSGLVNQQLDLFPYLEACLWLTRFVLDSEAGDLVEAFVDFYTNMKVQHPWLSHFMGRYGRMAHPLLPLLLEAVDSHSPELLESVHYLITRFSDRHDIEELSYLLQEYLKQSLASLSEHHIAQVALFGPSVLMSEPERRQLRVESERLFGVSVEQLFGLGLVSIGPKVQEITLETNQILGILDQINSDVETNTNLEKQQWRIRKLCWVRWSFDDQVAQKCTELLSILLIKAKMDPKTLGPAASMLFLKLFDFGPPSEDVAILVLRGAGKLEDVNFATPFFGQPTPDYADFILTNLESYLRHSKSEVRRGAAKLMGSVIDDFLRYPTLRPQPASELYDFSIKQETAFNLMENRDRELKSIGIKLLTFSPFSIEKERERLLAEMLECDDAREAEAWSAFITHVRLANGSEHLSAWLDFFENTLEKGPKLMPAIRKAVLSRYGDLITSQDPGVIIDEHKLDLPLSYEGQ